MSKFTEKFSKYLDRANGPDDLARDSLILAIALFIVGLAAGGTIQSIAFTFGAGFMIYSYWRIFSTKGDERAKESRAYTAKRDEILGKVKAPFSGAARKGRKTAEQMKDKEHRYFDCPKCGKSVRVPKGAGKIRVTCPQCGEKFERKA